MPNTEKTKIMNAFLGESDLTLTSEVYEGEIMDTKVTIEGHYVCTIPGSQREAFVVAIGAVVDEFRI